MDLPQTAATYADRYQDSHLVVDFERETAYLDGAPMKLTAKAFALLAFLVRHPGQLVPREALLMLVWGYGEEIRTRTLDVHIRRLRKSFGKYGTSYVETIFGVGYRFQPCRSQAKAQVSAAASVMEVSPWRWKMEQNQAY
jgi:DNA-binding response OmpR family regulator